MTVLQPVANSQPTSNPPAARTPYEDYTNKVLQQMRGLEAYFAKQIVRYRFARCIVIISAALVPVLATLTAVPRGVLAALGALAVATEGIQGLFQFQRSALNAMSTANALERVLNKYMTTTGRYRKPPDEAFALFVDDVEKIRESADESFLQTWQVSSSPSKTQVKSYQVTASDQHRVVSPPPEQG